MRIEKDEFGIEYAYIPAPRGSRYRLLEDSSVGDVRPFYMAITPLTGNQYLKILKKLGVDQSHQFEGFIEGEPWIEGNKPITYVAYDHLYDVYTQRRQAGQRSSQLQQKPKDEEYQSGFLSSIRGKGNHQYRLPTEYEWEWAALGGEFFTGPIPDLFDWQVPVIAGCTNIDKVAWHRGNSGGQLHEVNQKKPNGYGLYDMNGNVWEWTRTRAGADRVIRGGSWDITAQYTRVANRLDVGPSLRNDNLGFRLCFSA